MTTEPLTEEELRARDTRLRMLGVWTAEGEEWVIAYDAADAEAVYAEYAGETLSVQMGEPAPWTLLADDHVLRLREEDDAGNGRILSHTCAEWVAMRGRRYLGSANL